MSTSRITLEGDLQEDAHHQISRTGEASVVLKLFHSGRDRGVVVRAIKHYGTGSAAQHCAVSQARLLRRGVRVRISGLADLIGRRLVLQADEVTTPHLFTVDVRRIAAGDV